MVDTAAPSRVASRQLAFALRLQRVLAPGAEGTLCWSPFSVTSALGLAERGARGATASELRTLLAGASDADLGEQADALRAAGSLSEEPGGEPPLLAVSNTLWARPDIPVREGFAAALSAWPRGTIRDAPFTDDPEGARALINADVADTTRGLIPELIPPGAVDADTVAALVNALYLKVAWRTRFPENATEELPFHAAGGSYDTPTMRVTERLGYAHVHGWQAVALRATGGVDAVALLPDRALSAAEPELDAACLTSVLSALEPARVELLLPRFRIETGSPLTGVLHAMGAGTMFTPAADFSAMTPERLRVSEVLHQAVLRIDEQGLEGAAATAMVMKLAAMVVEPDPITVRVDRPFLFLVRHRETGVLYFLARVTAP